MLTNQVIFSYMGLFMFVYSVHRFIITMGLYLSKKFQSEIDLEIQNALS